MNKVISILGLILLTNFSVSGFNELNYYYTLKKISINQSEPVNASCGTIAGTITDIEPTINLCGNGSTSSLVISTTTGYSWTCSNGSLVESCSSLKSALCDNSQFLGCSVPNNALSYTSDLNDLFATWICENGSTVDYCNRAKLSSVNGVCGSANNTITSEMPNVNLCNLGVSTVVTSVPTGFTWNCIGSIASNTQLQGTTASCFATSPALCGSANGSIVTDIPSSSLCSNNSTSTTVIDSINNYVWTCVNGGSSANCFATKTAVCNNAEFLGCTLPNTPATNYTSTVAATTATWNCVNGASTVGCSRAKTAAVNGTCGSANGSTLMSTPNSNLCSTGNSTAVITNTTTYTWSCNGSVASHTQLGGSTSNCSANRQPICASGLNWNGTNCTGTETQVANSTCTSGYKYNGACYRDVSYSAYTCPAGSSYWPSNGLCNVTEYTSAISITCPSGYVVEQDDAGVYKCYRFSPYAVQNMNVTCPSGYSVQGMIYNLSQSCIRQYSIGSPTINCQPEHTISGTNCVGREYVRPYTYSCPSGWNLSGTNCTRTTTANPIGYY